jgi:hypothetical protein
LRSKRTSQKAAREGSIEATSSKMRNIYSLFLFVTCCIGWLRESHGFPAVISRKTRVGGKQQQHFKNDGHYLAWAARAHQKLTSSVVVQLCANKNNNDDNDGKESQATPTPTPSFVPIGVAAVAFVAFWPLLALLRVNGPTTGFDIDMFMALKGILDTSPDMRADEIYELPPLSPAEQLVGAIFGPPTTTR